MVIFVLLPFSSIVGFLMDGLLLRQVYNPLHVLFSSHTSPPTFTIPSHPILSCPFPPVLPQTTEHSPPEKKTLQQFATVFFFQFFFHTSMGKGVEKKKKFPDQKRIVFLSRTL